MCDFPKRRWRSSAFFFACVVCVSACSSSKPSNTGNGSTNNPVGAPSDMPGMPGAPAQPGNAVPSPVAMDGGVRPPSTPGMGGGSNATNNPAGAAMPVGEPGDKPVEQGRSVLEYHNGPRRDGMYVEPTFTRQAAAAIRLDTAFAPAIDGPTYAQPLFFDGGAEGQDMLIVATEQNQVSAFNPTDGSAIWQKVLGPPATSLPCGNINPLGVTGTPVIDPNSRTLYLDAMTGTPAKHMIFALSLDDGSTREGWPVDVNAKAMADGRSFESSVQNQRGGLTILDGMVYVPYGGHYGDCGNYRGWVVGVKLDDPNTVISWVTRSKAAGIWAPGGIASDGTSLYVVTGNAMADNGGLFSAPTTWGEGEAVIRLPKDLKFSMQETDFAAAMNWQNLDSSDSDIGGSGPMLFSVPGATPSELAIALGKDGLAYILSTENLGGFGNWVSAARVSSEQLINAPVAYTTPTGTFIAFKGTGADCPASSGGGRKITAIKIMPGTPPSMQAAWCSGPNGQGSPIVTSTDGMNESIVWYVAAESDNRLRGFNGETGEVIFDGGSEQVGRVARFQTPILAKGKIYVAAGDRVYAYTL
jgi:hypothetical protein